MRECIFCKIGKHEIPAEVVYEDDVVIAFEDINPQLPVHTLIIPKEHFSHIGDDVPETILGRLFSTVKKIAQLKGLEESGYRITVNTGEDARQSVHHLHIHVLGGAQMPIRMGPAD